MSLKFGIYLVEQRIITPEQFCGLVKIQQEATKGLASLAVEKNFLTIKQVATILDVREITPGKSFQDIAVELDYFDQGDAHQLLQAQQMSCPSLEKLIVECGLLTQRQASVLEHHFERQPLASATPAPQPQQQPLPQPTAPTETHPGSSAMRPRAPKFQQRPVIVHPYAGQHSTHSDY